MNILLIGTDPSANAIALRLLKEANVVSVHHFGAHYAQYPSKKYMPRGFKNKEILSFIESDAKIDLAITTGAYAQLWGKLQNRIRAKGIPVLMPVRNISMIEREKALGKKLLGKLEIPAPKHQVVSKTQLLEMFDTIPRPFVLRFEKEWLAGRQTVTVTDDNYCEVHNTVDLSVPTEYADADDGQMFLIEEFVPGDTVYSWHALSNAAGWTHLGTVRTYKARYENDQGFNTTGTGAYSPVANVSGALTEYANKIFKYLEIAGAPYVGILSLSIKVNEQGVPVVLDIDTAPGTPNLENMLARIDEPISELFLRAAGGQKLEPIKFKDTCAVTVSLINSEYPVLSVPKIEDEFDELIEPKLWPVTTGIIIATGHKGECIHSTVTTTGNTVGDASDTVYKFLGGKPLGSCAYRTDIGYFK